jgi:hypothetical protein
LALVQVVRIGIEIELTASAAFPPSFKMPIPMLEQTEHSEATAPSSWSCEGAGWAHSDGKKRPRPTKTEENIIAKERKLKETRKREEKKEG